MSNRLRTIGFGLGLTTILLPWAGLVGFRMGRESAPILRLERDDDDRACLEVLAERAGVPTREHDP